MPHWELQLSLECVQLFGRGKSIPKLQFSALKAATFLTRSSISRSLGRNRQSGNQLNPESLCPFSHIFIYSLFKFCFRTETHFGQLSFHSIHSIPPLDSPPFAAFDATLNKFHFWVPFPVCGHISLFIDAFALRDLFLFGFQFIIYG